MIEVGKVQCICGVRNGAGRLGERTLTVGRFIGPFRCLCLFHCSLTGVSVCPDRSLCATALRSERHSIWYVSFKIVIKTHICSHIANCIPAGIPSFAVPTSHHLPY